MSARKWCQLENDVSFTCSAHQLNKIMRNFVMAQYISENYIVTHHCRAQILQLPKMLLLKNFFRKIIKFTHVKKSNYLFLIFHYIYRVQTISVNIHTVVYYLSCNQLYFHWSAHLYWNKQLMISMYQVHTKWKVSRFLICQPSTAVLWLCCYL